ncbi:GNAT family N-acetyltransferase [Aliiglaciecola sp. 2_MG-2023]|uniref:GNAT family N-acetyltransferase n=1 Tax=unclassified Aliiglaciecola TaxID=2593648 RepID=UPI0026E1D3F2|nr:MULTISPECIES: GNAT family N-acetyltransferase [unclassified Aliiglaciecola]MDO6712474.1 GNAT family N-acetyltransferase [Aliiglaciecola sp. 2_MG-2023]MDO6753468.1 GNAT family N-acetyltransferase [Aliiglaciecola sp. 1_MG-2023]
MHNQQIQFCPLDPSHFERVLNLANHVHGANYLNQNAIETLYKQSFANNINASFVSLIGDELIGFRLTIAANNWIPDKWCTPERWGVPVEQVCYFKCNTVNDNYRGAGIGSKLLSLSIKKAQQQGALAGLAHIWLASPGNSAFRYFSKCGGKLVKQHPGKWQSSSIEDDYVCPVCKDLCECVAAEMLLKF